MSEEYTYRLVYDRHGNPIHELAKFDHTSTPIANYELRSRRGGGLSCTCPGSHGGRTCKHPALVATFVQHGWKGWLYEPGLDRWHDLFPLPRGANGLLLDVREEQLDE